MANEMGQERFEPAYLKLANAGDANVTSEITGDGGVSIGPLGARSRGCQHWRSAAHPVAETAR